MQGSFWSRRGTPGTLHRQTPATHHAHTPPREDTGESRLVPTSLTRCTHSTPSTCSPHTPHGHHTLTHSTWSPLTPHTPHAHHTLTTHSQRNTYNDGDIWAFLFLTLHQLREGVSLGGSVVACEVSRESGHAGRSQPQTARPTLLTQCFYCRCPHLREDRY